MMAAFDKVARKTGMLKRAGAPAGGQVSETLTTVYAALACTPLDASAPETFREVVIEAPQRTFFTQIQGSYVIRQGDVLVVDGVNYAIEAVRHFDWRATQYHVLMVQKREP